MNAPPPPPGDPRKSDADHLKLLAIFHFVLGGLALLAVAGICFHAWFMRALFENPEMWKNQQGGGPPPKEFMALFNLMYVFFGGSMVMASALNVISGWCLLKRRGRTFSLVVAGLDCLAAPFGTVLGVFTFVVLLRESVREAYQRASLPAARE